MERKLPLGIFFFKMQTKERTPLTVIPNNVYMGFLGGFITIMILALFTQMSANIWLMAPFGASCVLVYALWDAPLSQPRNVIGGHFISTFIGLVMFHLLGNSIWAIALGVGLSISCMVLTKTTHPPAGADPIVVIMAGSSWSFLFFPALFGAISIVLMALIINNLSPNRKYPKFWM